MKIAIVRKKYNPFGGAERYLNLLSTYLVREGHQVHIFANKWPASQDSGMIFHRIPMIGGLSLLKVWSFAIAAWVALRRFDADVIFSNERLFSQDILRTSDGVHRTWLSIRMKYSSPLRRLSFILNPLHLSLRLFDWYIFNHRAFKKIIAPSEFIKRNILKEYKRVHPEDIRVIYNGVDLDRFRPENKFKYRDMTRKGLGITGTDRLLLFIGTGFERKGLRYAIESLQYLPANIFLAVIGKGRTQFYKTLAEEIGVQERIRFLGPVEGVERYYAAADILVSPTLYEPMANVILEALATGIPVVTSRDCGNAEVITDGEDGWIIHDPTDAREIALRVKTAMERTRKPETAHQARKKAEKFTLERTVGEIMDVITRLRTHPAGSSRSASSILFLLESKNTPSSRLRVGNYLPSLSSQFSCRINYIPGSFYKRIRFYRNLPDVDMVLIQKKLFRPWELKLISQHCNRIIYDLDDAVIYRNSEEDDGRGVEKRLMQRFKATIQMADTVIAGNQYLADIAKPWAKRLVILPTPVDLHRYHPKPCHPDSGNLLTIGWIGTRGNLKYLEDLTPVLQQLTNLYPDLQIKVVCDAPPSMPGVSVTYQPWSLEDEVQSLQSFDIGVMPLRDNPWTHGKCGYKILQYMAAGVPSVTSPVGFNKTLIHEGQNGFLANTPEEWFEKLSQLIMDPALRNRIGKNGRTTVEQEYSLDLCESRFRQILESTLSSSRG